MQKTFKKAFPYFVLGLFVLGSLVYAAITKNPSERLLFLACGALIGVIGVLSPLHALFVRSERRRPFQIATTYYQNYRIPSLLFPYSSAGKKMLLVFGLVALVVSVIGQISVPAWEHSWFFLAFILLSLCTIGVSIGLILTKSGVRVLPEGLLLKPLLNTTTPLAYDHRAMFVRWESIKAVGLYETKSKKGGTLFVALRVSDSEFLTAPPATRQRLTRLHKETKWDVLIPAGTTRHDPILGPYILAAIPQAVVSSIDFYLRYPEARHHIGTQLSYQTLSGVLKAERVLGLPLPAGS